MIKQLLLFGAGLIPCSMLATDYFITPEGNGSKDGSTWENAMGFSDFMGIMVCPTTDEVHNENVYFFAVGNYEFTKTGFIFNSGLTLKGGYDATTGELAESGRTVFDGKNKTRSNGAFFLQPNSLQNEAGKARTVRISNIDFENFVTNNVWRNGDTKWNYGMPSALYIVKCGYAEITDCNFRNNQCVATGTYMDDNQKDSDGKATAHDKIMAGAVSLNRVNAVFRNCSFTGNIGSQGGAVKLFYDMGGAITKNLYTTFDRCYFANNKTSDSGAAIMARHTMRVNIINTTIVDNESQMGGGIFINGLGTYENVLNVVSSTVAGNTAGTGSQIYTGGKTVINVANSIIVAKDDVAAISDKIETAGYTFQGNNLIGDVAEGYTASESDDISAVNNYQAVFGSNVLAANGTLTPIKFKEGMAADAIASIVAAESWNYSVDCSVDQLGDARVTNTSNGALAVTNVSSGVDDVTVDSETVADESWYNLQGMRLKDRPTDKGIYIHKGKKIMVL